MKRRNFFSWIGVSIIGGLFGFATKKLTDEERIIQLIEKANPGDWIFYPSIIDVDHPEARYIEVIDKDGQKMEGVFKVETGPKIAHRWCIRRVKGQLHVDCDRDPITREIKKEKVYYARLQMNDGRDIVDVLGTRSLPK